MARYCLILCSVFIFFSTVKDHLQAQEFHRDRVIVFVPGIIFESNSKEDTRTAQIEYFKSVRNQMVQKYECSEAVVEFKDSKVIIQSTPQKRQRPRIYSILFSHEAAFDSLVYRALELDLALREISKREKGPVTIVSHSAGGLVARIVLQQAIPCVTCPQKIDHLITIGTPHQGAFLANNFSGLKGTRVACLQTNEPLIKKINKLPLPATVHITTFIVSTFGLESSKPGNSYTLD